MRTCDLHTHTNFCDGKNSPEEMLLTAISLGMKTYGFSGHAHAFTDPDCSMTPEKMLAYRDEVLRLRDRYRDRINVLLGLEMDWFSSPPAFACDYTIGSVHTVEWNGSYVTVDWTADRLRNWIDEVFGGDPYLLVSRYYETVGGIVERTGCDIIGHFDLVSKFNENGDFFDEDDPRYVRAWQSAADRLLATGKTFEINAGAIMRGYRKTPYPSMRIYTYLKERGASFTVNSDAHSCDHLRRFASLDFSAYGIE
ncbi:MAG: histidinol-phosphatase HisJ family protein [Clostridia bacterium]|nr:histidinol-phosphatase HisJ family protein [Clostridia bacterium]